MKGVLSTAMRRAMRLTREHDLLGATRVIQSALSGRAPASDEQVPQSSRLIELQTDPNIPQLLPDARIANACFEDVAVERHSAAGASDQLLPIAKLLRKADLPGFSPGGMPLGKSAKIPQVPVPDGAAYLARSFTCEAGSREYKVFLPSHRDGQKHPLIIMLHGCTQSPDDFAVGTGMNRLAEEHGCVVAYPRQSTKANQSGCWNWFKPTDQIRDAGEPSIIAGITRTIMEEFDIDAQRVYVAGLSAGGAMAAIMSATYPELYAATGIHSGLACGSAADAASAFAAMRGNSGPAAPRQRRKRRPKGAKGYVRTIVFHGASDQTVHPSNADMILAEARGALTDVLHEIRHDGSAGGRAYKRTVIADDSGVSQVELWAIEGLGHAWSGGSRAGSHTDQRGPDASREMLRFFLEGSAQSRTI
jgi:poly(hydroxyalkanoate) depolymerase family esterase